MFFSLPLFLNLPRNCSYPHTLSSLVRPVSVRARTLDYYYQTTLYITQVSTTHIVQTIQASPKVADSRLQAPSTGISDPRSSADGLMHPLGSYSPDPSPQDPPTRGREVRSSMRVRRMPLRGERAGGLVQTLKVADAPAFPGWLGRTRAIVRTSTHRKQPGGGTKPKTTLYTSSRTH